MWAQLTCKEVHSAVIHTQGKIGRNANIQRQRTDSAKVKDFWKTYHYVAALHHASGKSKMAGENKYIVKFKVEKSKNKISKQK